MRLAARLLAAAIPALLFAHSAAQADQARVAVAANFAEPVKAIAAILEKTTGHTIAISTGATGALYTQIKNGAPFDVFLAADTERPAKLEAEGNAVAGSRFTYATGQLVLWSVQPGRVDDQGQILKAADLGKVAHANPKTAPYGAAALQVLDHLGLASALTAHRVQGESIGQTYGFAQSGNADVGFVAMSQVLAGGALKEGSMWVIPQAMYEPIRQDAAMLKRGADNAAAKAFLALLKRDEIKELIRSYGYSI
jgi:molybdate transport system substrate-binding protein